MHESTHRIGLIWINTADDWHASNPFPLELHAAFDHPVDMNTRSVLTWLVGGLYLLLAQPGLTDSYREKRMTMLAEIQKDVRLTASYIGRNAFDERIMQALQEVPRHEFVPDGQKSQAYQNRPLPIGFGQTISQPYIVALMTDLLQPRAHHRVLEIGTGSGYQAAVLSRLVKNVYSIEIIEELGERTSQLFAQLGYTNIHTRIADGYSGWPGEGPFDGIIVTAAISHIPPPLVQQLNKGGRMVIPVGTRFQTQMLTLVEKNQQGEISTRQMLPVRFVPFTGGH